MNHRSPRRQKKQRQPTNTQQQRQAQDPPPAPELAAFSLAAAIQEARTEQQQSQPQQPRSFFQKLTSSSPLKKKNFPSQASLATNTSFATANGDATNTSFRTSAEEQLITPSAASYFVDSDDSDEETTESLTFGNDPLSVLSRNIDLKPTEISFVDHQDNPEETITTTTNMAKKKTSKIAPTPAVVAESTPVPEATPTTEDSIVTSEDPHFDVAQTIYGTTKNIWAWGKTIPVISSILSLTEGATAKVLDVTIHMDLPSIDQDVVTPKAKELDDGVITPVICKIWELVGPAVGKGEDMIVKPFVGEVVPRVLGPLGLLGEEKKVVVVEEKKNVIDGSDNPEVVPPVALN